MAGEWPCPACTYLNPPGSRACAMCGAPCPTALAAPLAELQGEASLQYLPRCVALVQYGGGDDMRQADALLSLPLAACAVPGALRAAVGDAVDAAVAARNESRFESLAAENIASAWDRQGCSWEAALAVSTEPSAAASWANLYWHGWLFHGQLSAANAVQRFPLVGVWEATNGLGPWQEDLPAFGDTRSAGDRCLLPADQHAHKIDPYAGGDREGMIGLYMEEGGMDRATAEAAVLGAELQSDQFHVGSDSARVSLQLDAGVSSAWVVCVDLAPGQSRARVQLSLLLVAPRGSEAAAWFGGWSTVAMEAEQARRELSSAIVGVEGLTEETVATLRAALDAG